jgi:hypothetical protein
MAKLILFKKRRKNQKTKPYPMSDYILIRIVSQVINENPNQQDIAKGVWIWNRTDHRFSCSLKFCEVMNVQPWKIPDLDLWTEILNLNDLVQFAEALDGILKDFKPRNFVIRIKLPDKTKKIIQCFLETNTYANNKNYVIGVFCDVTERIFTNCKN